MDQMAKDLAAVEIAAFAKALDEVLARFGFHAAVVMIWGKKRTPQITRASQA